MSAKTVGDFNDGLVRDRSARSQRLSVKGAAIAVDAAVTECVPCVGHKTP